MDNVANYRRAQNATYLNRVNPGVLKCLQVHNYTLLETLFKALLQCFTSVRCVLL